MGIELTREEIPLLADYFVRKYCEELACPPKKISSEALQLLKNYSWQGHFSELEGVIKRAVILKPHAAVISEVSLPPPQKLLPAKIEELSLEGMVRQKLVDFLAKWQGYEVTDLHAAVLRQVERPLLELILQKAKGNQVRAARMLGIHRNTLAKKIKELHLKTGY